MKAKRIVSLVLVVLLLCTLAPATFASTGKVKANDLYILSKECPEELEEYAEGVLGTVLRNENIATPYIGTPFTFSNQDSDVYYFPIYSNGKIVLTFRVYLGSDGEPTGVLSPMLAEELNAIAPKTSAANPLRIVYETVSNQATISFKQNNYEMVVHTNYDAAAAVPYVAATATDGAIVVNSIPTARIQVASATRTNRVLTWDPTVENQGSQNWCLAFCTAAVMRYAGFSTKRAADVMQEIYGADVTSDTVMRRVDLVPYMQGYYFFTVKSADNPSISNVLTAIAYEILASRPVILNMYNVNSGTNNLHTNHAIVAVGYDDVDSIVTVWNPWYRFVERVLDIEHYVPVNHRSYDFTPVEYWRNNYR